LCGKREREPTKDRVSPRQFKHTALKGPSISTENLADNELYLLLLVRAEESPAYLLVFGFAED
jgi:hypothetical protein